MGLVSQYFHLVCDAHQGWIMPKARSQGRKARQMATNLTCYVPVSLFEKKNFVV